MTQEQFIELEDWLVHGELGSISPDGDYTKFQDELGDAEVVEILASGNVVFRGITYIRNGNEWVEFNPNSFVGF